MKILAITEHAYAFVVVLFFFTTHHIYAQESKGNKWLLAKEEDGIEVYTRKVEGYQIKEIKVETVVDIPIEYLYQVLIDFDRHEDWMVNFGKSELLSSNDSSTFIYYVEIDAPWPVMDRDLVIKGALEFMSDSLVIISTNKVEGYKKERNKFIRIPMMKGQWQFLKLSDNRTKIINRAHGDPGGMIPGWIVNIKLVADPIKSIKNFIATTRNMIAEEVTK